VKKATLLLVLLAVLLSSMVVSAQAHYPTKPEPYATMTLKEKHHHFHVIKGHAWGMVKHPRTYRELVWHRQALRQINIQLDDVHAAMAREQLRKSLPPIDSCLMELIRREASGFRPDDLSTWRNAAMTWNGGAVGIWQPGTPYGGSGAYGVPQALPGDKMSSAGSDWATNPVTQIRWMIGYVNGRYGGSCNAVAHHNMAGYY